MSLPSTGRILSHWAERSHTGSPMRSLAPSVRTRRRADASLGQLDLGHLEGQAAQPQRRTRRYVGEHDGAVRGGQRGNRGTAPGGPSAQRPASLQVTVGGSDLPSPRAADGEACRARRLERLAAPDAPFADAWLVTVGTEALPLISEAEPLPVGRAIRCAGVLSPWRDWADAAVAVEAA